MADATITLTPEEQAVISALEKLNVISLNNVVKYMEETYGISAAAPAMMAAAPAAGGGAAAPAEDKAAWNVELTDAGAQKIAVIKAVREVTGLALGDAKAIVDGAPKMLKENVPTEDAKKWKDLIEKAGAKVTLK